MGNYFGAVFKFISGYSAGGLGYHIRCEKWHPCIRREMYTLFTIKFYDIFDIFQAAARGPLLQLLALVYTNFSLLYNLCYHFDCLGRSRSFITP